MELKGHSLVYSRRVRTLTRTRTWRGRRGAMWRFDALSTCARACVNCARGSFLLQLMPVQLHSAFETDEVNAFD
ncbi:hypothetical protein HanIR_Chr09g0423081 [Helianthus annuus]|nr:hypothetical protein HanIR_Chr09g0423081 [Helianthus annuus]